MEDLEQLIHADGRAHSSAAEFLASLGTPSASVAVLDNGVITSHCFSTVGDDPQTVFQACSISKPIAALAIMRLVEQGMFALDSTLVELLEPNVMASLTEGVPAVQCGMMEGITVRQLMSHTAGLSQGGFTGYAVAAGDSSSSLIPSAEEVLMGKYPVNSLRVQLQAPPGHSYAYSGGGITVLQVILETVTGKPFATLMQDLVLGPLGMDRSFYTRLPEDEDNAASAHYTGYTQCEVPRRVLPEQAAAGLYTTPTDLLKAVLAVQNSLGGNDDGFLHRETAETMLKKVDADMALSWFVKGPVFSHAGSNDPGFRCNVVGFAGSTHLDNKTHGGMEQQGRQLLHVPQNCGVAIMTNSAVGGRVIWKIFQAVAFLKKWPQMPLPPGIGPTMIPFALPDADAGRLWRAWKGTWTTCGGGRDALLKISGEIAAAAADDDDDDDDDADDASQQPSVWYNGLGPIRLFPIAAPESRNDGDDGFHLFLMEGFSMMVDLMTRDGVEIVELRNNNDESVRELQRVR